MVHIADCLLKVTDLHVVLPTSRGTVRAVDGISLEIAKGEFVGIVGESGSGKSMTALAVLGLIPKPGRITTGSVELAGIDIASLDEKGLGTVRRSNIAMIFQDAGSYLNPIMTIGDQIAEAIGQRGSKSAKVRNRVLDALNACQIVDPVRVAASYPHELSGGMQQRAMIASVLIREPSLIIADEPTTALDATVQKQILTFFAELRRRHDMTLILISHDLAVISEVCDRVYVMYAGQIVEEGSTVDLFDDPKHPYTQALVDAILDPFAPKTELKSLEGFPPDMADPPSGCRFHSRCSKFFSGCDRNVPELHYFDGNRSARCHLYATAKVAIE